MCVKIVIALLAIAVTLCLVEAQNLYTPAQLQQQQRNDDFEQLPKLVTEFELEVRLNTMPINSEDRQPIVLVNLNHVEQDRIIITSQAEEQQNENRRQEFNERERVRDNNREFVNMPERVIEFDREREPYRRDQERGPPPKQEFIANIESRPDRNSGFNRAPDRDNDREFVSESERIREFHREQEREPYRSDHEKDASTREEFRAKPERKPDRNSGFNRATEQSVHRNNIFKQEVDVERKPQRIIPQGQEEKSHRLCERKYNEYIARIFRNDEEITADANDSEFDGRVLASPGEYPHMTALGFEREDKTYDYKCGGSLISENFVITAAHCTNITGEVPTIARIGDINLMVDEKHLAPQIFPIRRIYTHPQYDGVTNYNDIALLQLNTSVEFTEFVRPIKLWTKPKLPLITAFAMGYGATSFARAPTQQLTDFNMTLIANDECNQLLPQLDEVPRGIISSQICAEDFVMHRDTCQGDSGGPLQYNIRGKRRRNRVHYHLIGITSFGLLCRSPNPGVYTRIFSYLDWIERTVWNSS
ncbi:serine protease Hayan [Rhagoletis pomonella]|uniref:serine protease Hayan n=1 Tax=Rhagoletis pomonella TaxID=28610 RepID=UPI00178062EC|nr:serine protease Hayan [Rhagoletis pomonella]